MQTKIKTQQNNEYKETELGLLPEDWEIVKLGKIITPDRKKSRNDYKGNIPIVQKIPFDSGKIVFRDKRETHTDLYVADKDHLITSKINFHQGAIAITDRLTAATTHYEFYKVLEKADILYLWRYFRTEAFKYIFAQEIKFRGFKKEANFKFIKDFKIPLPPLPEQKAIAFVLSTIQTAKEKTEQIIKATKELKKSMMKHLFTYGPVSLEEAEKVKLKETEIGEMPEEWEVVRLEEVAEITYGVQAAVAHLTDASVGIPILTNINIKNEGYIDLSTLRYYNLPESKRDKLILKKSDVLFNWRSGSKSQVGKTALFNLDGDYTFSSFILRFRVNNKINNIFLIHYLHKIKEQGFFSAKGDQSSVNAVFNASLSAKIPVFLPPLPEQKQIAEILSVIDEKIQAEENKKKALEELFKSMLHNLMTAKIRVRDLGIIENE